MALDKQFLFLVMQRLSQKYVGKGVDRVLLQSVNGKPAFVMQGSTPQPPPGLPGGVKLSPTTVMPIIWAYKKQTLDGTPLPTPNEIDVDKALWYGFVPIERRDVAVVYKPGPGTILTQEKIPPAEVTDLQIAVDTTGTHGWWDINVDVEACLCCSFYGRPVTVLTYVVPQDRVVYFDGWSFFVYLNIPIGWVFNVKILRDGDTLVDYDEVVVDPANPDPARRCLFSGSTEQVMKQFLRIDRNQTLSVVITPKGLYPYLNTVYDSVCGNICVLMHGRSTALLDNRDGAPRPKDVGRMRDGFSWQDILDSVTAEDLAQLMGWLNGATADAVASAEANGRTAGSEDVSGTHDPRTGIAQQAASDKALVDAASKANENMLWAVAAAAAAASVLGDSAISDGDYSGSSLDTVYGSSVDPSPLPEA